MADTGKQAEANELVADFLTKFSPTMVSTLRQQAALAVIDNHDPKPILEDVRAINKKIAHLHNVLHTLYGITVYPQITTIENMKAELNLIEMLLDSPYQNHMVIRS